MSKIRVDVDDLLSKVNAIKEDDFVTLELEIEEDDYIKELSINAIGIDGEDATSYGTLSEVDDEL